MSKIDFVFPVSGKIIPADHGYHLLSAISGMVPFSHSNEDIGIHSISGILQKNRILELTDKSKLNLRIPHENISNFLKLSGEKLQIDGKSINVGVPTIRDLVPASRLYSRLVIIRGFMKAEPFLDAIKRHLEIMKVYGKPSLIAQPEKMDANKNKKEGTHSPYLRRTVRIRKKEIVGFAVRIEELTAEESILVQEKGIGGRRRFGCGLFVQEKR
jgi:CRISPR-associated protein Cas6